MIKILLATLGAIILAIICVTSWFLLFGPNTLPELGQNFVLISRSRDFWLGIIIFSIAFFMFFTLPLTLILAKE